MSGRDFVSADTSLPKRPLRILVATEYLPPYVSGIANRFKNLTKGYKDEGHQVTIASVAGTACDLVVPSIPNLFYPRQRMFIFPPLLLIWQLLNPFSSLPYDIVHLVSPLCLAFVPLAPLFKLRGVKVYVSYHVYMEFYKRAYFYNRTIIHKFIGDVIEKIYTFLYFIPLVAFADIVGVPSKTADSVVFKYSKKIHYMKSGLDTTVFAPRSEDQGSMDDLLSSSLVTSLDTAKDAVKTERMSRRRPSRRITQHDEPLPPYTESPYGSVDSPVPTSTGAGCPVLVYVGRLAPEKNVQFLVSALAHPSLSTATLVIVGDGPSRPMLETLARSVVGAENVYSNPSAKSTTSPYSALSEAPGMTATTSAHRVIFTGMVLSEKEVSAYYAHADIFVSASASETFGFTVAEALACGTPAVVVREGAFKTVYKVIDEWMFHEGDVEDFVTKVLTCYAEGRTGRKVARKLAVGCFGVRMAVRDLLGAYETLVWGAEGDVIVG